jgi:hypothetical protein
VADCFRLEQCRFFKNIAHLPKTAEQLATIHCRGDNSGCARHWVASAGIMPPDDLFPNERDRALLILAKAGKATTAFLQTLQVKGPGAK